MSCSDRVTPGVIMASSPRRLPRNLKINVGGVLAPAACFVFVLMLADSTMAAPAADKATIETNTHQICLDFMRSHSQSCDPWTDPHCVNQFRAQLSASDAAKVKLPKECEKPAD
jgi:hypothetical protein